MFEATDNQMSKLMHFYLNLRGSAANKFALGAAILGLASVVAADEGRARHRHRHEPDGCNPRLGAGFALRRHKPSRIDDAHHWHGRDDDDPDRRARAALRLTPSTVARGEARVASAGQFHAGSKPDAIY